VVAAVNGHALAGGCVLAAACDLRLMSGGTIGLTELAVGVPFPTVPLEIMRHAAGPALDAMVLGAGRLTPGQAASIGLVHEVVEPDQLLATALRRADGLCAAPAGAYAFAKHQLRRPALERIDAARSRQVELLRQTRHLHARPDLPVALPVQADENVALRQVGAVQIPRRMRTGPQLEQHRRQPQRRDSPRNSPPLRRQLTQCGAHEHPQTLVRGPDNHAALPQASQLGAHLCRCHGRTQASADHATLMTTLPTAVPASTT
jgi:Enoyl-CoA hydratase/isomerase